MRKEESEVEARDRISGEQVDQVLSSRELTQKECEFIKSICEQQKTRVLSEAQVSWWNELYKDHNTQAQLKKASWVEKRYDKEKRKIAKICAAYYYSSAGPRYFKKLAKSVLTDESFVPTEKQWRAMCTNKYARKVIEATEAPPRYEVGSFVSFRQGAPHAYGNDRRRTNRLPNCALVLETDAEAVTSAAKGTKKYKILIVGDTKSRVVEERYLKPYRRKK